MDHKGTPVVTLLSKISQRADFLTVVRVPDLLDQDANSLAGFERFIIRGKDLRE
jgi:hypothetical protein